MRVLIVSAVLNESGADIDDVINFVGDSEDAIVREINAWFDSINPEPEGYEVERLTDYSKLRPYFQEHAEQYKVFANWVEVAIA